MSLAEMLFWTSTLLLVYALVGYCLIIRIWSILRAHAPRREPIVPTVSVVIVAQDEEARVEARLKNLLELDYPKDRLEVILASDGSRDRTVELARAYESERSAGLSVPHAPGQAVDIERRHPPMRRRDPRPRRRAPALRCGRGARPRRSLRRPRGGRRERRVGSDERRERRGQWRRLLLAPREGHPRERGSHRLRRRGDGSHLRPAAGTVRTDSARYDPGRRSDSRSGSPAADTESFSRARREPMIALRRYRRMR